MAHNGTSTLWKRIDDYVAKHGGAIFLVTSLLLVAGVIIASFAISDQSHREYDATMASFSENNRAAVAAIEDTYGATDVVYDGSTVTMTVGDKSFHCEGVKVEDINAKKSLRCTPLVEVESIAAVSK